MPVRYPRTIRGIPDTWEPGFLPEEENNEWSCRGYLPHINKSGISQFITFRLADALPTQVLTRIAEKKKVPTRPNLGTLTEETLDRGHGECLLARPVAASIVETTLLHFDGIRYDLEEWVIMPNHVHALVRIYRQWALSVIVQAWKSVSAHKINSTLRRSGRLWQREYFDRYIRDENHHRLVLNYIRNNPVKAGLVSEAADWRYSSAWGGREGDECRRGRRRS